jgi:hypothetical protein
MNPIGLGVIGSMGNSVHRVATIPVVLLSRWLFAPGIMTP